MNKLLYFAAKVPAGIVLVLLLIDPARLLAPICVLLGIAVVLALLPWFLTPRK
jgi:hypothetical protein